MQKRVYCIIIGLLVFCSQVYADSFTATQIKFVCLKRISSDTALSYLPVRPGDEITPAISDQIINDLYKTGFFSNVSLSEQGSTLIINVAERPIISKLVLSGNKVVPSKELLKVLREMNIAEGYEYNRSTLKTIETALLDEYYSHGKYNARINIQVVPAENDSVAVYINISEGLTATIKQINIIGNEAFSEHKLSDQFQLTTPSLFSFINHDDQYSSEKLAGDLDKLTAYYLNRGYIHFRIDSSQVSMTPDRKHVYITIKIIEGAQYKFSGYQFSGNLILPKNQLQPLVQVKAGNVFSKQAVIDSEKAIGDALGAKGYSEAKISVQPAIDEQNKTIFVTFTIHPGQRIYVRHVYFVGNSSTNDFAFRREITQMEGGLISTQAIKNSKQNIQQLRFVSDVEVTPHPVPGKPNEVDVGYKVTTVPAGEVTAWVGYSDVDGLLFNIGLNQQNVLGTGNAFSVNASYSASMLSAQVSYFNPYYTTWGVGRGFNLYASHYNADQANTADYALDSYGGAVNYSIPLAQYDSLQFSIGLNDSYLQSSSSPATVITNFVNRYGRSFFQIPVSLGWNHNSLDKAVFPTLGLVQNAGVSVDVPVEKNSLEFYKLSYGFDYYHPVYEQFIAQLRGDTGYGNGYGKFSQLPFFENFYAGGMGSVRGYTANTLGPQDNNGDSVGGNLYFDASVGLIFPNPFSRSLRTTWFVDAGDVYNTYSMTSQGVTNPDKASVRYSTGIEFDWLSPIGMLNFSLAKAINPSKYDDTTPFQFNIGT